MVYKFFALTVIFSFGYSFLFGDASVCVNAVLEGVGAAVELALILAGIMCFWNGIVSMMKGSRFLSLISFIMSPITNFLFKSAANDQNIKSELSLFMCSNMLGLGNAATPIALGLMKTLDDGKEKVNSDIAMLCLTSTAPICLIPTTVLGILHSHGFKHPALILPYIWLCSFIPFIFAVILGKIYSKFGGKNA